MFDFENFKTAMYNVISTAEENDVSMYDLVNIAAEYIKEHLEEM